MSSISGVSLKDFLSLSQTVGKVGCKNVAEHSPSGAGGDGRLPPRRLLHHRPRQLLLQPLQHRHQAHQLGHFDAENVPRVCQVVVMCLPHQ